MKNFYLLLSGILLMMLVSCAQAEISTVTDEPYGSIEETYFKFYNSIQQNLNDELCQIGANSTRFNVDESVVGTILQMTKNELKTFVSSEQRALAESRQDSIFSKFFTYYSDEDYLMLKKALDSYILIGGHDSSVIDNISKNLPTRLVKGYVYMCATADNLASKEIWCWLDESVMEESELQISLYKHDGATEIYCRQAFWNKIRLIALSAGSEYLASMVCGPVMPEADTLVTVSNLVDAGAAAYDYYACCHYAVP